MNDTNIHPAVALYRVMKRSPVMQHKICCRNDRITPQISTYCRETLQIDQYDPKTDDINSTPLQI